MLFLQMQTTNQLKALVVINTKNSYAVFNFYSKVINKDNRQIMVSSKTAAKIILNKKYNAIGYFETRGTCTPEMFTIQEVPGLLN